MANYTFKDASGTTQTAASDVVSSVNYPYIKLIDGTAGGATNVAAVTSGSALKVDGSAVTQPASLASLPALAAGTNIIGKVTTDQTTHGTTDLVAADITKVAGAAISQGHGTAATAIRVELPTDSTGVIGATQSGTWTVQPGNTANTTPWLVTQTPATSGGLTYSWNSIKATATSVKGSAGQVFGWYIYNSNSSVSYVQFFNTASGSVTLGVTTPVYSLGIPATSAANAFINNGIAHSTAITIAATTTATGSTNPTNNVDINVFYK